jgi:hypothetical protein
MRQNQLALRKIIALHRRIQPAHVNAWVIFVLFATHWRIFRSQIGIFRKTVTERHNLPFTGLPLV